MKTLFNLIAVASLLGAVALFTGCASKPPPSPVQRIVAGEGVKITERDGMLLIEITGKHEQLIQHPILKEREGTVSGLADLYSPKYLTTTLENRSHTAWDVVRLGIARGFCDCGTELVPITRPSIPPQAGALCPSCGKTK